MILPTEQYSFRLLTACFCGGADSDNPKALAEMRVPSIRGQVRAWHREVARPDTVNRIWGSTAGKAGASRVALILDASSPARQATPTLLLPHDPRKPQGRRPALAAGQDFSLTVQRLVGCQHSDWTAAQNAVKLWLLIGGLGLRVNRAAGSVWPVGNWVPQTSAQLREMLRNLKFLWPVRLVQTPVSTSSEELRRLASDTVKGRPELFGEIKPHRSPSPTKFKVIELDGQPRLLVTAAASVELMTVRTALSGPNKAGRYPWEPL
jgi:RAMP superfamily protein